VTERIVPLWFSGELDNAHCDVLLPAEKKEKLVILYEVFFVEQGLMNIFYQKGHVFILSSLVSYT
jgi:hypothetical protein